VWDDDLPLLDGQDNARSPSTKAPADEARRLLDRLVGVDLGAIPGLHASTGQTLLAEIGLDMGTWPNETAFCAWLGLAPRHESSGGKGVRRSPLKPRNRAGQAWRLAAQAAGRSPRGVGAFSRRRRARLGPQSALVATAHTIVRSVSPRLNHRKPRHNFVYLSADLSRPYRLIVTPRICRCGLFPGGYLVVALWGVVTGSAGLGQTMSS
jgi:Transposase IS116/IS110/IS902 family